MSQPIPRMLNSLTSTRFLAALGVILSHYVVHFSTNYRDTWSPSDPWWARLLAQGSLGVDFFFLLSGFILAYTYALPDRGLRGTKRAFWVARIARIYPVYLLGLLLDIIPFLGRSPHLRDVITMVASTPLLIHAWFPAIDTVDAWNPPSWSLCAEALFYLLFPLIIVWMVRLSRGALIVVAALSYAIFALLPFPLVFPGVPLSGAWGLSPTVVYNNPLLRMPEFVLGVGLGLIFMRTEQKPTNMRNLLHGVALVDLVGILCLLLLIPFDVAAGSYPFNALAVPFFAGIIYLLARQQGVIARVLSNPRLVWLGEISYGMYILHWPLWAWTSGAATHIFHLTLTSPLLLAAYLIIVVIASGLSYEYLERPARKAIRARWGHARSAVASTAPSGAVVTR